MRISRTLKVVGSLVLGLALVCGVLWILAPKSAAQVEAQVEVEEDGETLDDCEMTTATTALDEAAPTNSERCVEVPE